MKVELIYPIATACGSLTRSHYIRTLPNGKQVVAHKPNRNGHVKTADEAANQRRFAERYAKKKTETEKG